MATFTATVTDSVTGLTGTGAGSFTVSSPGVAPVVLVAAGPIVNSGSPAFGAATQSGDLLIAAVGSNSSSATFDIATTAPGWRLCKSGGAAFDWVAIFYKESSAAGETAPVFTSGGSDIWSGLIEYKNAALSSVADESGNGTGTSSLTLSCGTPDTQVGDLAFAVGYWNGSNTGGSITVPSFTDGAGVAITPSLSYRGNASGGYLALAYGVTGYVGTGKDTITFANTVFAGSSGVIASFKNVSGSVTSPVVVTTSMLPPATTGVAYSAALASSGGDPPVTWAVSAGSLPAGLSLAAGTGVISGTPTTVQTSPFTVKATDSTGASATASLTLVVSPPAPTYMYTTSSPTGGLPPTGTFSSQISMTPNSCYVIQDVWNPTSALHSQVLSANSAGQWQVVANIDTGNTAVLSYPDTQVTVTNSANQPVPFTSFTSIVSTFGHQMPSDIGAQGPGDDYEAAYDIWLGTNSSNYAQEVMIWTDTHNQRPAGNDTGKTYTDANGVVYEIWTEAGNTPLTFVRHVNTQTGTTDLLGLFNFMVANGYTTMTGINQIDYGFELCSTSGLNATFVVTDFTLVAS